MLDLDLSTTAMPTAMGAIPKGKYEVACVEALVKKTKAGTGNYINAQFKVMSGEYRDRVFFHIWNIVNPNPQAVQISKESLKQFLTAAGHPAANGKLNSVSELRGLRALASVKVESNDKGESNKATWFDKLSDDQVSPATSDVFAGVPNFAPAY